MKFKHHVLLLLGFAGFIASVVLLRKTSPSATADSPENAAISTISSLRNYVRTLMSPPYIYLLLNFIIISIAASSSLLHRYFPHNHQKDHNDGIHSDYDHNDEFDVSDRPVEPPVDSDANSSVSGESDSSISGQFVEADDKFDGKLDETWSAIADEKRNVSGLKRSALLPDGDVRSKLGQLVEGDGDVRPKLGELVERDDDGDTLEALWKSIADENRRKQTENQTPPLLSKADLTKPDDLTEAWEAIKAEGGERRRKSESAAARESRRLRKSESTFGVAARVGVSEEAAAMKKEKEDAMTAWKELRKSETFNDAVSARRRGGLLRKDPSLSLDELNGRVEAFIKNFNHQMRLQRQESEQRFLDMMNRGV